MTYASFKLTSDKFVVNSSRVVDYKNKLSIQFNTSTMQLSPRLSLLLLICAIISFQFESCHGRSWHYGFNQFPAERGHIYFFYAIPNVRDKRSAFEKILIHLKDIVISSPTSDIPENIKNHLNQFSNKLDKATQGFQQNSTHTGRYFKEWLRQLGNLVSETGETVVGDVEDDGQRHENNYKSYEYFRGSTETIFDTINDLDENLRAIIPETLWCGLGNRTGNDSEVELFKSADNCCKAHDQCSFKIEANARFGPLANSGIFRKTACFCDREFYTCMRNAKSIVATKIAITYFTLLSPQCIGIEYPKVACAKWKQDLELKCISPIVDRSKFKELQWFSSPDF